MIRDCFRVPFEMSILALGHWYILGSGKTNVMSGEVMVVYERIDDHRDSGASARVMLGWFFESLICQTVVILIRETATSSS